ncbi:hypothetical protein HDK64DRAFT_265748 [Phyllosticta capitalensis]
MEHLPWKCFVSIVACKNMFEHELNTEVQALVLEVLEKAKILCCSDCRQKIKDRIWTPGLLPDFGDRLCSYFQTLGSRGLIGNHVPLVTSLSEVFGNNNGLCSTCMRFLQTELPKPMQDILDDFKSRSDSRIGLCLQCVVEGRKVLYHCSKGIHEDWSSFKRQRTS